MPFPDPRNFRIRLEHLAEDVGLLPGRSFTELLNSVPADGSGFPELVEQLFREMNTGTGKGISIVLRKKLLQFNGGLFSDFTVLPVNGLQLGLLEEAAQSDCLSATDSQVAQIGPSLRPSRLGGLPGLPPTASLLLSEK